MEDLNESIERVKKSRIKIQRSFVNKNSFIVMDVRIEIGIDLFLGIFIEYYSTYL